MARNALIVGNSDGIGLAVTKELLQQGWNVIGISRSASPIEDAAYNHHIIDVQATEYVDIVKQVISDINPFDLCIYCVGIGELLDYANMAQDETILRVNLVGLARTVSAVIPQMIDQRHGHFIGLSSVADEMISFDAPSYHASKAGFSNYLEGLALALKSKSVTVTNIRFGFVDTKMAKGDVKPFMLSLQQATKYIMRCIDKKPIRFTAPKVIVPFIWLRKWAMKFKVL